MTSNRLEDFDFELPPGLIAQRPAEPRHAARLLHVPLAGGAMRHTTVMALPDLLPRHCLLVVNDTRVVPARLMAHKPTGGRVELLLCAPVGVGSGGPEHQPALARSNKPLRPGMELAIDGAPGLSATVDSVGSGGMVVLRFAAHVDMAALLVAAGRVPLPPYIRGGVEEGPDRASYQCVYAVQAGAVAAPTAGLHLSTELLARLDAAGVERCALTLHVGPGTFLPVREPDLRQHRVLAERFSLSAEAAGQLAAARRDGRPIVATGTTTTRVLETLAARYGDAPWPAGDDSADLTILPGHRFGAIAGLMTNFHLPRSSLLVLLSAFAGRERVLAAYNEAVRRGYRFYSYGDATLWL